MLLHRCEDTYCTLFWLKSVISSALFLPSTLLLTSVLYLVKIPCDDQNRLGIAKQETGMYGYPNRSVTMLCKRTGWFQIKEPKSRQSGIHPAVIAYADKLMSV